MRRLFIGVVAWMAASGCSRHPDAYVLGAASPQKLSYGISNAQGINLAVEEINAAGGIRGVPLKVDIRDDEGSGIEAVKVASSFVQNSKIVAVIGHAGSGAMVPAARVYDAGKLVAVGTTPSTPDLTGLSPWVFRLITSDSVNGGTLAQFASHLSATLGRKPRAAVLYANDAYGRGLADAFVRHFDGVVVSKDPVGVGSDFEPFVSFYKAKSPDVVFVASTEEVGLPLLREARRQNLQAMFLGGDGWQGVVADTATAEGVYVGTPFTAQSPDTASKRFVAAFRAKYGKIPDAHAALAYDATRLIARAIEAVGADRKAVRGYLANLSEKTAYRGVTGVVQFDPSTNDPIGDNFRVTRVQRGLMMPERAQ